MSTRVVQTFLFADLAGFTATTEAHGDEEAADLVEAFCGGVRGLLAAHGAEEVKSIGDALLLRCPEAAQAIALGLGIVNDVGATHGFPMVRVGMHTGTAVERGGDWFGSTVNLASRISGAAAGGEVLLSEATARAAGDLENVELYEHGRRTFKNVAEPVVLFGAHRAGARSAAGLPIDPVCRMAIDPDHAAGTLLHEGTAYHFCSLECAGAFARDPGAYV